MSPLGEQVLIREAAPHAAWVPIPSAGHLTPLEVPAEVAAALLGLVAGRSD